MKSFGLAKKQRIKNSRDFASIYERRVRASDNNLLVWAALNSLGHTRFGVSVSRKLGGAVQRTALKRLLREAFRLTQHELPANLDLILIPQRSAIKTAGLADYQQSLVDLAARLARRIATLEESAEKRSVEKTPAVKGPVEKGPAEKGPAS
jgi:ribonuclease P protein component